MARLKCVACGHTWPTPLNQRYPKCGVCLSYDVVTEEEYDGIMAQVDKCDPKQGRLRVAVLKAVLQERGFRFKPAATLSLVEAVLDKAFSEQPVGMTVLANGTVFYQMKRVKRRDRSTNKDAGKDSSVVV